jgi:hypothetical protein
MAFLSGLRNILLGKPPEFKRLPRYEGGQQDFLNQILGNVQAPTQHGLGYLSHILAGDDRAYQDLQRQATDFFEGNLLPSLSQRYGSAAQGEGRSSAFLNELSRQGRELSAQLGSQGLGMRSQALSQLSPFLQLGLTPQHSIYQTPQGTGLLDIIGQGMQGFGQVPGATLGGGMGGGLGGLARMLPMLGGLF